MKIKSLSLVLCAMATLAAMGAYNVRRPSDDLKPRWKGAKVGQWTFDYNSAYSQAKVEGRCTVLLNTAAWWCPYCEALEEKVILSDAWRGMLAEKGYYLAMLDYPYRGDVKEEELSKSKYPQMGKGWGFQCWLYDDAYLSENGLTAEDGFRAIQGFYEYQKQLAPSTATPVTIKTWDGQSDFTYGKVGYPTIIVFLPDGREAGRFSPSSVIKMEPAEAQTWVIDKIDSIVSAALEEQCGLCTDTTGALTGETSEVYNGWLSTTAGAITGTIEVKAGKANSQGKYKTKISVVVGGKKTVFSTQNVKGEFALSSEKDGMRVDLSLGPNGLAGSFVEGAATNLIRGARDVFKAKDAASSARAASVAEGSWNIAMRPVNASSPLARGYGGLSATVKKNGSAKVKGVLGDGTKVSYSGKMIVGEDGVSCLPVSAALYTKKQGGFGCVLWFKDGWLFTVTGIAPWRAVGKNPFEVDWKPIYTSLPGFEVADDELELVFADCPSMVRGMDIAVDPDLDEIKIDGANWRGTDRSLFKVRCDSKTGLLSGSMKFVCDNGAGKQKKVKATVKGVVSGGTAYCTVLCKDESWSVKVSACDACEE